MEIILGIVWFVLLGFLPGYVLIGVFRLKEISWVKGLLYIVGISMVFDMCVGFAMNFIYPRIGFVPFDPTVMRVTWLFITFVLITLLIIFQKQLAAPYRLDKQWLTVLLIYVGGVLLIYQTSLLTNNLVGSDIHLEYYYAHQPVLQGSSNVSTYAYINICLPITVLIPMYSVLTGIEVMWVFKVVQPLVLAILPVILYKIFKLQFGKFVGILSVVFFITLPFFTMDIVQLIRQQYAMIFFGLVTLVLMGRSIGIWTKILLASGFGIGVIISHYGVGTGFMWYLAIGCLGMFILRFHWLQRFWEWIIRRDIPVDISSMMWKSVFVWVAIAMICIGGGLLYYKYVGSGVAMKNAVETSVHISQKTVDSITTAVENSPTVSASITLPEISIDWWKLFGMSFREPLLKTAIGLDFGDASPLGKIWRIFLFLVEFCIIVGVLRLIVRPMPRMRVEYFVFTVTSAFVVIGLYTLPTNGFGLGAVRVLVVTLIFMSPLFIFGLEAIIQWIVRLFKKQWKRLYLTIGLVVLLLPYILFNSGAIFELIKSDRIDYIDIPFSPAFSGYRLDMTAYFADEDVEAMEWLQDKISKEYPAFGDWHSYQLMWQYVGEYNKTQGIENFCKYVQGYVFLRKWNVDHEMLTTGSFYGCRRCIPWLEYSGKKCESPMTDILERGVVVFDNGAKIIKVDKPK